MRIGRPSKTAGRALRVSTSAGKGDLRPGGRLEDAPDAIEPYRRWLDIPSLQQHAEAHFEARQFHVPMDRGLIAWHLDIGLSKADLSFLIPQDFIEGRLGLVSGKPTTTCRRHPAD